MATTEKSSPVGNMAAMRDALIAVKKSIDDIGASSLDCDPTILMSSLTMICARLSAKIERALAEPPRYCDVMSLESARKLWFAKEIVPRLDGDLPLGKEIPFEEWFVSKLEQETKGVNDEQK